MWQNTYVCMYVCVVECFHCRSSYLQITHRALIHSIEQHLSAGSCKWSSGWICRIWRSIKIFIIYNIIYVWLCMVEEEYPVWCSERDNNGAIHCGQSHAKQWRLFVQCRVRGGAGPSPTIRQGTTAGLQAAAPGGEVCPSDGISIKRSVNIAIGDKTESHGRRRCRWCCCCCCCWCWCWCWCSCGETSKTCDVTHTRIRDYDDVSNVKKMRGKSYFPCANSAN